MDIHEATDGAKPLQHHEGVGADLDAYNETLAALAAERASNEAKMELRRQGRQALPPESRVLTEGKVSQTFLSKFNSCERSALLYEVTGGGAGSHAMLRGSGVHEVVERLIRLCVDNGEPMVPPDLAKAIVNEVLAELPIPLEEHDYLRECAFRFAGEFTTDPLQVRAIEQLMVLRLGRWTIRGKIDYAIAHQGGAILQLDDWKSSRALPAFEELSRKRPDGSVAAKAFQLVVYALMAAYGLPVTVQTCDVCAGTGHAPLDQDNYCVKCSPNPARELGRGTVETVGQHPIGGRAQKFMLALVFPGIESKDGTMARRDVDLDRLEVAQYRESLIALLGRLETSIDTDDWPAVPGPHCSECPAEALCPIPAELRDFQGAVTPENVVEAATRIDRAKAQLELDWKAVKALVKETGIEVYYGENMVVAPTYEEKRLLDRDGLQEAIDRGERPQLADFTKVSNSTPIKARKLKAEELAELNGTEG